MEMKVIRKATKFNKAYYVNLPRVWVENNHITRRQPLVVIMKDNGDLEIKKLRSDKHE